MTRTAGMTKDVKGALSALESRVLGAFVTSECLDENAIWGAVWRRPGDDLWAVLTALSIAGSSRRVHVGQFRPADAPYP